MNKTLFAIEDKTVEMEIALDCAGVVSNDLQQDYLDGDSKFLEFYQDKARTQGYIVADYLHKATKVLGEIQEMIRTERESLKKTGGH